MKVTIIIPNYNGKTFYGACLASLNEQRFQADFKILIVDNASTDGSLNIWNRLTPISKCWPWILTMDSAVRSMKDTSRRYPVRHSFKQ